MPRGRKRSDEAAQQQLADDLARAQREVLRLQALNRTLQRTVGVRQTAPARKAGTKPTQKTRRPNRQSRGERVLRAMQNAGSDSAAAAATMPLDNQPGA